MDAKDVVTTAEVKVVGAALEEAREDPVARVDNDHRTSKGCSPHPAWGTPLKENSKQINLNLRVRVKRKPRKLLSNSLPGQAF